MCVCLHSFMASVSPQRIILDRVKGTSTEWVSALVRAIGLNQTLRELCLDNTQIGPEEVQVLAQVLHLGLQCLSLKWNQIGDPGARVLGAALKDNQTLQSLNLEKNAISVEGVKALAEALKTNRTLQSLNLDRNAIGLEGVKALAVGGSVGNKPNATVAEFGL